MTPIVLAHSISEKEIIKSDGTYNIKFSKNPEFPVINEEVHLDFEVWDNRGKEFPDLDFKVGLVKNNKKTKFTLGKVHGHYELEHNFGVPGKYKLIPYINDKKLNMEFEIEIDSFGLSGVLRVGIIILLLLILLFLMFKTCRGGKK